MRDYFFIFVAVMIPAGIMLWFLWMVGKSLFGIFQDWRLHRELDDLQARAQASKQERGAAEAAPDREPAEKDDAGTVDYTSQL